MKRAKITQKAVFFVYTRQKSPQYLGTIECDDIKRAEQAAVRALRHECIVSTCAPKQMPDGEPMLNHRVSSTGSLYRF